MGHIGLSALRYEAKYLFLAFFPGLAMTALPITGEKPCEPLLPYWSMKAAQPLETSLNTFHMASGFAEASRSIVSMTSIFSE